MCRCMQSICLYFHDDNYDGCIRQYADFKKASKHRDAAPKDSKQDLMTAVAGTHNILFTETMANAYQVWRMLLVIIGDDSNVIVVKMIILIICNQEWNVVKKNKFGRKQERVFGVDGKKVYNSKKGNHSGSER